MRLYVYALKNDKAGFFYRPTFSAEEPETMKESFKRAIKLDQIEHAEEQSLYFLGIFEDKTGNFSTKEAEFLASGTEFIE